MLQTVNKNLNEMQDVDDLSDVDLTSEYAKKIMSLWGSITDETFKIYPECNHV